MVAEINAGQSGHGSYNAIPSIIYTSLEAWVGKTEQELTGEGIWMRIGSMA